MQRFQASNDIVGGHGGVKVGGVTYSGKAVVPYSGGKTANQINNEMFESAREEYGKDIKRGGYTYKIPFKKPGDKEETTKEGLDIVKKGKIKEIVEKEGGGKLLKGYEGGDMPKDIIFIKPGEQKHFTGDKGYSDFSVTDFSKTTGEGEGEGKGKEMESLSDFTDSLDSGSYAISLEGDKGKIKEVGVSERIITKAKEGETYDPITGMFISESPTGVGATGIMRPPTVQEQKKIERAEALGGYAPLPEGIEPVTTVEKIVRKGIDFAGTDVQIPIFGGTGIKVEAGLFKEIGEEQLAKEDITFGEKLLYTPFSKLPTTYGDLAVLGGAGYLAPVTAGIGTGAMLFEPLIKEGLIEGGRRVEQSGKSLRGVPYTDIGEGALLSTEIKKLGFVADITGKAIQGASFLVPEKPVDVLSFALFEKALTSKMIPKVAKSVGLKGLGGYEIYGGITDVGLTPEERYGKFLIGGLAGLGGISEDVTLARTFKARFLKDFKKTKVEESGILKTELDLGKNLVDLDKGSVEILQEPLKLEFIPGQKEVFTKRLIL